MITLASQSAARAAMLSAAGVSFTASAANVDEEAITAGLAAEGASAARVADALAEVKAVKVSRRVPGLVLGADSIVVTADGRFLAKPGSRDGAAAQLRGLSGTTHQLVSAAVIAEGGVAVWRATDSARLTMRTLSDAFIADYLDRADPGIIHCVGSYHIEGIGAQLFTRIDGDQFTIRGLPLLAVLDYLRLRGELAT
ncbi:MAG: Maf family protein [Sphingomonadaceae bacterium]|nr:Maf family protein [Sphingomonadaceae bacterium]